MRLKLRKSTKRFLLIGVVSCFMLSGVFVSTYFVVSSQTKQEYEGKIQELTDIMDKNKSILYELSEDIKRGEVVTRENVRKKEAYDSSPVQNLFSEEDIGKSSLLDLNKGTHLLKSMVVDWVSGSDAREVESKVIRLSENLEEEDYVDIRLFLPNGEDFVVLSKKEILFPTILEGEEPMEGCYLWLEEREILNLSSAIVDAYQYTGAFLYTVKYIEPILQKASIISYIPSISTLKLLETHPWILEEAELSLAETNRKLLENRLSESLNKDVKEVEWDASEASVPEREEEYLLIE